MSPAPLRLTDPGFLRQATIPPAVASPIDSPVAARAAPARRPLGSLLVDRGLIDVTTLHWALERQAQHRAPLGSILMAHGCLDADALADALARQHGTGRLDAALSGPRGLADAALLDCLGPADCLAASLVPVRRAGAVSIVATARPDLWDAQRGWVEAAIGPARILVATPDEVAALIVRTRPAALVSRAESRTDAAMSCRDMAARGTAVRPVAVTLAVLGLTVAFPATSFTVLTGLALLVLLANTALKAAMLATLGRRGAQPDRPARHDLRDITRLPRVSVLVPLHRESAIADTLVRRLSRLDYPRELLEVLLVTEAQDAVTAATLARTALPPWMRTVQVPRGSVTTKPRAMNYALDFCTGAIVGIYDAEDAPEPDQLALMVRQFAAAPPEVACLQGRLDFYNARSNWMARCFALEYATWFRFMLPGLRRLGLAIPLGGTTLFFRRETLDRLGAWDAHNVTEDADLGMRLARAGYRTDLLDSTTFEEATNRPGRWIRQRSRWLKGYAVTYAVHMRDPAALWRDLGPRGFAGFQLLFLGALGGFVLAPFLWGFWLLFLVGVHPWSGDVGPWAGAALMTLLAASAGIGVWTSFEALKGTARRGLAPWLATTWPYFALGTAAAVRALGEMVVCPFFWAKTMHGLSAPDAVPVLPPRGAATPAHRALPVAQAHAAPQPPAMGGAAGGSPARLAVARPC